MKKLLLIALLPTASFAMDEHSAHPEQAQWMLSGDQLEWRDADEGDLIGWDISGWYGGDIYRVTASSQGEALDGDTEAHELELGLQKSITPFWNLDAGWRRDLQPDDPSRDWAFIGASGTAPWFIETDAKLFVGESGLTNLSIALSYELLFTQKLILEPELEINAYGKDDKQLGIESGLTSLEAGLRLRYELVRQFAPYIGAHHEASLGDTADLARAAGEDTSETLFVAGVRFWY